MADPAPRPSSESIVLVVDDEPLVRRFMARALSGAGYQVLEAPSGTEAVAMLSADPAGIQLVVSDIAMPEMSGLELAAVVRERWPTILLLLVSGQGQPPVEYRGSFLPKPFAPDSLVAAVVSLMPG
jgi:two-component system cell cycle sensor histidine kinase/response regulator CckA